MTSSLASSLLGIPLPESLLYPSLLFLGVILTLILIILIRAKFVADNVKFDDVNSVRRRRKLRIAVFILRLLCVWSLVIALATPLAVQQTTRDADLHITVLLDNSSSMAVLDTGVAAELTQKLREQVATSVYTIGSGQTSDLGDGILEHLKPRENIILITDGYSTAGTDLATVAAFARQQNSTIMAISLKPKQFDAAVTVDGPQKAIADTNTTLTIRISRTEQKKSKLRVAIDDVEVYADSTDQSEISVTRQFAAGKHKVVAQLLDQDFVTVNNQYDYLLTVVEKPRVLVVSQRKTGLHSIMSQLYSVTEQATVPTTAAGLAPYYAVILVDLPASAISPASSALSQYVLDGNGLFVVGGSRSYDFGNYKNSAFESLLPVSVGQGRSKGGVTSIAMALDISGSVGGSYVLDPVTKKLVWTDSDKPALVRSLALSVLKDIDPNNQVGAVVIGAQSTNFSQNVRMRGGQAELIEWDYIGGPELGKVSLLGPKKAALEQAVSTVRGGGHSTSQYWIAAPAKALETAGGGKNIIVFTDGQSCTQNCLASQGGSDEESTLNLARVLASQGGKLYIVGVEDGNNDDFLAALAEAGNGVFFRASQKNSLRILFGDPSQTTGPESYGLVTINTNHFITRGTSVQANMYGYNQVVPKGYASMLIATGSGQPALTVWSYGVGRVAALTVYNGDDYGELLIRGNSLVLSRTGNWLVGDPERKAGTVLTVPHMYAGEQAVISVTSDKVPVNDQLRFAPRGKNLYEATFTPLSVGFGSAGGIPYAASYALEFEHAGMNPELEGILAISQGKLFDPSDVSGIIEHAATARQVQEQKMDPIRYPFILLAALCFLIEIAVRRLAEVLRKQ